MVLSDQQSALIEAKIHFPIKYVFSLQIIDNPSALKYS